MHSGAGRIRSVVMRTMSLAERGAEAEPVSLVAIAAGSQDATAGTQLSVKDYADFIVSGGWPEFRDLEPDDAQEAVESYLTQMSEHDYPEVSGPRRDPRRFFAFLKGYAGLVAQPATAAAIRKRIGELSSATTAPAADTVNALHDFATRLFLIEDQPAWSPQTRSKSVLVKMPRRHLADVSLAAALLGASSDKLLVDLETMGIFFESLMVHDLRVYGGAMRARGVYHYRDMKGRDELDAVLELRDGSWMGFEAKLSHKDIDAAAANLTRVAAKIEQPPAALAVVVPTGPAYQRPSDGVWVLPLAAIRP